MKPFSTLIEDLGLEIDEEKQTLSNKHVIPAENLIFRSISYSNKLELKLRNETMGINPEDKDYENKKKRKDDIIREVGIALQRIIYSVPYGGILVFF